jgi:hypothetical protein
MRRHKLGSKPRSPGRGVWGFRERASLGGGRCSADEDLQGREEVPEKL